jgi:apolipoprotein N-acyltransferase
MISISKPPAEPSAAAQRKIRHLKVLNKAVLVVAIILFTCSILNYDRTWTNLLGTAALVISLLTKR